jgi:hypothetical protein
VGEDEDYVRASGGRARLRQAGVADVLFEREIERPSPAAQDPLRKLVQELADENLQLRLKVVELEAQLVRRS